MRKSILAAGIISVGLLTAQTQTPAKTEGARDLFFAGEAPKEEIPPRPKTAPKSAPPRSAPPAIHMGLRYTLLQVRNNSGMGEPVDPSRNFRKGDCLAVRLETNRSGYLYVLAKQSDGNWAPLVPDPENPDEDNRIDPGRVIRAPKQGCFEIEDPPGAENLFVALSRSPQEIAALADSIKEPGGKKLNDAVNKMTREAGTRDLPFTEVAPPERPVPRTPAKKAVPKQPGGQSVYIVDGSNKASSTLITRIEISHK